MNQIKNFFMLKNQFCNFLIRFFFVFSIVIVSTGCGGNGSGNGSSNTAPVVDTGERQTIRLPENQIQMNASSSDDGFPGGSSISYAWSKESGAGNVTFSAADVLQPTVTFDSAGTYILKLIVSDSELSASDTVTVIVNGVVAKTNSIEQYGITWSFDKEYQYGQYATGDYWVVGPVKIIDIAPHSIEFEGIRIYGEGSPVSEFRVINGSMINVDPEKWDTQGFSSGMEIDYDATRNVARPNGLSVSDSNSIDVPVHSSLISSITRKLNDNDEWERRPLMDSMAILTVVEALPDDGDFRPPYTGTDKSSQFNISDLKYSFLPALEGVAENPDISTIEAYFERPWVDFTKSWTFRDLAPLNNMAHYGREYAAQTGMAALTLSLDFTNEEKKTLLTRYVQLGLDLHGSIKNGMEWHPNGGFFHGRKLPILFAGNVLNSETILNDLSVSEARVPFQEDGDTFYVTQADVDRTNSIAWRPNATAAARGDIEPYSAADIGMPEWGVRHNVELSDTVASQPEADNRFFNAGYRLINGNPNTATVLAVYILGLKEQWNWDVFFDYQDRHVAVVFPKEDSVFYYAIGQPFVFAKRMWEKYRGDYTPVFESKPEWLYGFDMDGNRWD